VSEAVGILRHPVDCLQNAWLDRFLLREQKMLTRRLQAQSIGRGENLWWPPGSHTARNPGK
jgi:hypothetical protein